MNEFKVKTKGGRVLGEKEPPRQGGSVSAFEDYVLASKVEKDTLREKLKEFEQKEKLLAQAQSRISILENRTRELENGRTILQNQRAYAENQRKEAKAEEQRLSNLVGMLKEENNLQKGQICSLLEFQKAQEARIEVLKQSASKGVAPKDSIDLSCECPVCMGDFDDKVIPVVWQCGHMVCEGCTDKMTDCPTCREPKQYVSAKCTEYLRLVEILRKIQGEDEIEIPIVETKRRTESSQSGSNSDSE